MHLPPILFPAFSVASPVTIELGGKQYRNHASGSRYPEVCKTRHCRLGLDSAAWPEMAKLTVFFSRISSDSSGSRDTNSRSTCDPGPPRLGASLLIASGSMKRPAKGQPGGIIPCVSKGISCP